ncbi:MAG TPA: hypothetical protein PLA50_13535 [Bacteroidia bacterium]|nr:hypothetical protein [Bacteroidia bacterium]
MRVDVPVRRWLAAVLMAMGATYASAQAPAAPGETEEAPKVDEARVIAQRAALPMLGGDRPFILRESSWSGEIAPGTAKLIQLQLFKRNDYHFWLAVPDRRAETGLGLYNAKGEAVSSELRRHDGGNVVSLSASPEETGIYYLRISMGTATEEPQRWVVIYAYR